MPTWSLLSGSPRLGEAHGARGLSSDGLLRRARLAGVLSALPLLWAAGGLLALLLDRAGVAAGAVALLGILPAAALALALALLARGGERRGLLLAAAGAATVALALAAAGHLLHPRGEPLRPLMPPGFGDGAAPTPLGVLLVVSGLLLAPLLAGLLLRAWTRAFDASGTRPLLPGALWRDFRGPDLARVAEAWLLPGLLALDLAGTLALRLLDRARARARDRLHAHADLDRLAQGLAAEGAHAERDGATLRVRLPDARGPAFLTAHRLAFPRVEARDVLDLTGQPDDVRRLRRLLEGPLGERCLFAWSRVGRRVEARLNALQHDARRADTTEERGLLLDEADRTERALAHRDLNAEEWGILVAWKLQRLRGSLVARMLTEPPGARPDGRVVAPAPTLVPPLARAMEVGGLAAMRRAVHVPHWIVPVRTTWGESEVVVNALTGKADAADGPALLDAMTRRGPTMLPDAGRPHAFLQPPVPTAALLRELRPHGNARPDAAQAVELVYVPIVPTSEGHVNAITGTLVEDPTGLGPTAPGARHA